MLLMTAVDPTTFPHHTTLQYGSLFPSRSARLSPRADLIRRLMPPGSSKERALSMGPPCAAQKLGGCGWRMGDGSSGGKVRDVWWLSEWVRERARGV